MVDVAISYTRAFFLTLVRTPLREFLIVTSVYAASLRGPAPSSVNGVMAWSKSWREKFFDCVGQQSIVINLE